MKDTAIKSVLKMQQLLLAEGHSYRTTHFTHTIAQVSSLVTSSARYLAICDAMNSDCPKFTQFSMKVAKDFFFHEMRSNCDVYSKSIQREDSSKRRRLR